MKQWLINEEIWSIVNSINFFDSLATFVFIFSKSDELEYDKNLKFIEMNLHYEASKLNAKAQYQLLNCIDENDAKMMIEKTKVKNIWNRLVNKYKIKLQTIERQYFVELVNYKKFSNMNIEFIYIDITKKSRKIAKLQSNMKSIALLARRFQTLLQSLLDEYNIIRDVIDAQINSNIETSIQKLQEKKTQLQIKNKEMIMLIKDDNRKVDHSHDRDRQRSTYRISQRRRFDNFNNIERRHKHRENKFKFKQSDCFLCDANHRIKNCSFLRELRKLFKYLALKKKIKLKQKQKTYNANDNVFFVNNNVEFLDIAFDNEENMKEIIALFKELINIILKSNWIVDIDVTSHMIDQLRLFSESLRFIKRRTIKIEEKRLYSNQCETMTMKILNDECKLTKILYVLDIEINLLFERRFTRRDLRESFDNDDLYIHSKKSVEMIRVFARDDIYIVDKIALELNELALSTITISSDESTSLASIDFATKFVIEFVTKSFTKFVALLVESNSRKSLSNSKSQKAKSRNATLNDSKESSSNTKSQEHQIETQLETHIEFNDNSTRKKRDLYTLWHRRVDHLDFAKLKNLHKITTFKKSLFIVKFDDLCEICAIIKMTNKRNRTLIERRSRILTMIFIDICESLLISRLEYEYFLKIINNHSRRTWILSLRKRFDALEALWKWKLKTKLQCFVKLQVVRNDNVIELKFTLDEWCTFIDIELKYTIAYNFIQNDVIERDIKIIENQVKVMIQDVDLLLKFWLETIEANAYVRNRVAFELVINDDLIVSMKTFTNVKSFIDHLRVWECKCYSSIDIKSLLEESKTNKFVNRERFNVFMRYDENIITQYRIWTSNRQEIIKHHKVIFSKNEKWESASLNLKMITFNVLFVRRLVDKSRKIVVIDSNVIVVILEIMIIEFSKFVTKFATEFATKFATRFANAPLTSIAIEKQTLESKLDETKSRRATLNVKLEEQYIDDVNDVAKINELIVESTIQTRIKLASLTTSSRQMQQFLHVVISKRKRHDAIDEEERDEHKDKIHRVMLTLLAQDFEETKNEEWALTIVFNKVNKHFVDKLVIFVSKSYKKTIKNLIWDRLWLKVIQIELTTLIFNDTWEIVVFSKEVNLVINKKMFKVKIHIDDILKKFKARLVARDFSQMYEIDYTNTFVSIVKFDTLRLFLVIVTFEDLKCHQVDVNNAFTKSFLKKIIYMKSSLDVDLRLEQALLIRRSLYELK